MLDGLWSFWNSISWGTLEWGVVVALVALVLGWALYRLVRFAGLRYARRTATASDDFIVSLVARILQFTVYLIGLLLILDRLGFNLAPLLTGAGVFGLLLGFIGRDLFANTLAGIWIINERPYDIGHRILLPKSLGDLHGPWGDVVSIGLRSTNILSVDGVMLTVPNSVLVNDTIVNFSHVPGARMRARIRVGVVPDADNVRRAVQVAREAIRATEGVYEEPRPVEVIVRDFRDWDVQLEARFFVDGPRAFRSIKSEVIQAVLDAFAAHDIRLSRPVNRVELLATDGEPLDEASSPLTRPRR